MLRLLTVAALAAMASAADIVVFGDSWGTGGRTEFAARAAQDGLTVDNRAIGGTTAAFFARPINQNNLRNAVRANEDAKFVWLTIGGNDALPKMALRQPIEQIIDAYVNDTSAFLEPLFEDNEDIVVVSFGYEMLNWGSLVCGAMARAVFWECDHGLNRDIQCVNEIQFTLQLAVDQLAEKYDRFYSVNLYGAMQADAGVAGASVGNPVWTEYVDQSYMSDCIHPNNSGYRVVFAALWDEFFTKMM